MPQAFGGLGLFTCHLRHLRDDAGAMNLRTGTGNLGQGLDNVRTEAAVAPAGVRVVHCELSEGRNGVPFISECSVPSMIPAHSKHLPLLLN